MTEGSRCSPLQFLKHESLQTIFLPVLRLTDPQLAHFDLQNVTDYLTDSKSKFLESLATFF